MDNLRQKTATGAARLDSLLATRLRAGTVGNSQVTWAELAESASEAVSQIAPNAGLPMRKRWKRSTFLNTSAAAEGQDLAKNARIVTALESGTFIGEAATKFGVSVRAVRAIFGSDILGLQPVACNYTTLRAARAADKAMKAARCRADRAAALEAMRAKARAERAAAAPGSPTKKRSMREMRADAKRKAAGAWARANPPAPDVPQLEN